MKLACESCGYEPRNKTCPACAENIMTWAKFCPLCGEKQKEEARLSNGDPFDMENRRLCPDGNCIGIIGADGRCVICGKSGD